MSQFRLIVPDYEQTEPGEKTYPGDIKPGTYSLDEVVELLRFHKGNPEAIHFIADMLEE